MRVTKHLMSELPPKCGSQCPGCCITICWCSSVWLLWSQDREALQCVSNFWYPWSCWCPSWASLGPMKNLVQLIVRYFPPLNWNTLEVWHWSRESIPLVSTTFPRPILIIDICLKYALRRSNLPSFPTFSVHKPAKFEIRVKLSR